ncbi:tetratricopeptide repeat protein [Desulfatirhabdium butyrativorans]|uniref:tetratricopeptide repeat protein n=1 Tax=Desulfatirhabdium butyrativorans TaxID=340467 RepID=UPI000403A23E|nr:tetratricopeptide repeat protein [Desulfatirhabdium butyrativorans]
MNAAIQPNVEARQDVLPQPQRELIDDEFLRFEDFKQGHLEMMKQRGRGILFEMDTCIREKRWEDIVALGHPLADKLPDLIGTGMEGEVRSRVAFAFNQLKRFDDALAELVICIEQEQDNFLFHTSMAYTAYNSLYAAKNREIFLAGPLKTQRIDLAHRHFRKAQLLRPDGVTNFYREGMLFKQIEGKGQQALPLFQTAVSNWEALDAKAREERHQERKNYIKALYQLASVLLERGDAKKALELLQRCLQEDEATNHITLAFKYFALGKIRYSLRQLAEARDALVFAATNMNEMTGDFIYELLARVYLDMNNPPKALETIEKVPPKLRRPFVRWTEADIHCALKEFDKARSILIHCQERDKRSRHKSLIRLVRIEYLHGKYQKACEYANAAVRFFQENWGRPLDEGLFWQAACRLRMGDVAAAKELANQLQHCHSKHPKLAKLMEAIGDKK